MKIYTDIQSIEQHDGAVVTIGTFDGVHLGHVEILKSVIEKAKKKGSESFAVTFDPHPRIIVSENYRLMLLTSLEEKKKIFEKIGIDNLLVINFTKEFSKLSAEEFLKNYICKNIKLNEVIIGYDHKFGKNRDGDEEEVKRIAKQIGFEVSTCNAVKVGGEEVSSTKIRKALLGGELDLANKYLGRYYTFNGKIIKGEQRGREIGFPTANIDPRNANKLIPKSGVYTIKCDYNNTEYFGVMNIGERPTFSDEKKKLVEVHLFDFEDDIYEREIKVYLLKRLRDEKKFNDVDELIAQINKDVKESLEIIDKLN